MKVFLSADVEGLPTSIKHGQTNADTHAVEGIAINNFDIPFSSSWCSDRVLPITTTTAHDSFLLSPKPPPPSFDAKSKRKVNHEDRLGSGKDVVILPQVHTKKSATEDGGIRVMQEKSKPRSNKTNLPKHTVNATADSQLNFVDYARMHGMNNGIVGESSAINLGNF